MNTLFIVSISIIVVAFLVLFWGFITGPRIKVIQRLLEKTDINSIDESSCFGFFRIAMRCSQYPRTDIAPRQQCSPSEYTPTIRIILTNGKHVQLQRFISLSTSVNPESAAYELRPLISHSSGTLLFDTEHEAVLLSSMCDLDIPSIIKVIQQGIQFGKNQQLGFLVINGGTPNTLRTSADCMIIPLCQNSTIVETDQALFLEIVPM